MSITFQGTGSGLPISDWITALLQTNQTQINNLNIKKSTLNTSKSTLNTVQSKFSSLRTALEKLTDANLASTFDLFKNKTATSSDTSVATVTASQSALTQNITLKVDSLATATTAKTTLTSATVNASSSSKIVNLTNGNDATGDFTINVGGTDHTFTVDENSTIDSVINDINKVSGLTASYSSGIFNISSASTLALGASSDTSEFLDIMKLQADDGTNTSFSSSSAIKTPVGIGANADPTEALSQIADGSITGEKFSLYVNGAKKEFTIDTSSTTLNDVITNINSIDGLTASYDQDSGKFSIIADNTKIDSFSLGSSSDDSNFWNVMQLSTSTGSTSGTDTTYSSSNAINSFKIGSALVGSSGDTNPANTATQVTAGTFTIGGDTFTIAEDSTSLSSLISQINSSKTADVTAQFDSRTGTLKLTSKNPGEVAINLGSSSDTSNFLQVVGLVDGSDNSLMSQTLGTNAKVYINDSEEPTYSSSNTLSSDITGIAGVSINLLKTSDETVNINVNQDTSGLSDALSSFITKFNNVINEIDTNTTTGANLKSEYTLVRLKDSLRFTATNAVSGLSTYDSLAMIGITTGSVGTSVSTSTKNLTFDEDKFIAALQDNPDEVKKLLIGDTSTNTKGILQQLEEQVENALDPSTGYFASRKSSIDASISALDKSIIKSEEKYQSEKARLTTQFNAMDQLISQLNQQSMYYSSL